MFCQIQFQPLFLPTGDPRFHKTGETTMSNSQQWSKTGYREFYARPSLPHELDFKWTDKNLPPNAHTDKLRTLRFNIRLWLLTNHQWIIILASPWQNSCHNPYFFPGLFICSSMMINISRLLLFQRKTDQPFVPRCRIILRKEDDQNTSPPKALTIPLSAASPIPSSGSPVPLPVPLALLRVLLQPAKGNTAVK